jgi:hypothetical protein
MGYYTPLTIYCKQRDDRSVILVIKTIAHNLRWS